MTWPSVPSSSSFCLITHYFILYSLESDSFRGQRVKQYIENINLSLLIFTSFAAVFHYKIPFHINQCPWVGHINESSNIFSCLSIYTQTSVLCLWVTVKKNVVGQKGKIKKCTHVQFNTTPRTITPITYILPLYFLIFCLPHKESFLLLPLLWPGMVTERGMGGGRKKSKAFREIRLRRKPWGEITPPFSLPALPKERVRCTV